MYQPFDFSEYTPPTTLERVPEPRNEIWAFLLSFVVPGLGQLYCGEKARGIGTFLTWAIAGRVGFALVLTARSQGDDRTLELLGGILLRVWFYVYLFGFLDAYYTAVEKSEGIWALQPYQPRLAALLNLVTRGFGYWHVDERGWGFAAFFVLGALTQVSRLLDETEAILWESMLEILLAVLAIHAYRLARAKNLAATSNVDPTLPASATERLLPSAIPLGLGGLILFGYIMLPILLLVRPELPQGDIYPDYAVVDQSQSAFSDVAGGRKMYSNALYGVQIQVPRDWELYVDDEENFVNSNSPDGDCEVVFYPDTEYDSATTAEAADYNVEYMIEDYGDSAHEGGEVGMFGNLEGRIDRFRFRLGDEVAEDEEVKADTKAAEEVAEEGGDSDGGDQAGSAGSELQETVLVRVEGATQYWLLLDYHPENASSCNESFDEIVSSVVLPSPPPMFPSLFY